jgi:hypothetical protein
MASLDEADGGDEFCREIEITGVGQQQLQPIGETDDEPWLGNSGKIDLGKTEVDTGSVGRGGV